MPLPALITRLNSYTAFQQAQGDGSFPGTQVDADYDQIINALDGLVTAVRAILRDDGVLANGSVPRSALAADVMVGLGASRPWSTGKAYAVNDTVTFAYGLYVCLAAHTASAAFATDLGAGRWVLQADLSQAVVIADGSITTGKLPDGAVTEPKLAAGAASTRAIADGAVTRVKADPLLGVAPIGVENDFAGVTLPVGWLFCAGQAVSRTTYSALFAALTALTTANSTTSSTSLTGVASDLRNLGLVGAAVEGPGVPSGTLVTAIAAGTITLSNPISAGAVAGTFRLLPWGRGDGTTTFNIPDRRSRPTVGRDDMGGAASGRLSDVMDATILGASGGAAKITLTNAQLPAVLPNGSVTVSYPAHVYRQAAETAVTTQDGGGTVKTPAALGPSLQNTSPPGPQSFTVTNTNGGGGNAFAVVQPTGVGNRIIFAGV